MAEPDGFETFVTQRQGALLRLAWALTGDRQLAEDLAQAALVRLWVRWNRVAKDDLDPWPYLQRVTVSINSSWSRRRWRGEIPARSIDQSVAAPEAMVNVDDRDAVRRWLELLPTRQRAVIVLRYLEDLSVGEAAHRLDCSAGTIKSQTAKALTHIREASAQTSNAEVEDES